MIVNIIKINSKRTYFRVACIPGITTSIMLHQTLVCVVDNKGLFSRSIARNDTLTNSPCFKVELSQINLFSLIVTSLLLANFEEILPRTKGTPNELTWPGVTDLPDYKPTFPSWPISSLKSACPRLDAQGLDLLEVFIP